MQKKENYMGRYTQYIVSLSQAEKEKPLEMTLGVKSNFYTICLNRLFIKRIAKKDIVCYY